MGFRVGFLLFRVWGFGLKGLGIKGLGFRVGFLLFRVWGFGLKGLGFRV